MRAENSKIHLTLHTPISAIIQKHIQSFQFWATTGENLTLLDATTRAQPLCTSAQPDQQLCCSLPGTNNTLTCYTQTFNILALVSVADQPGLSLTW